MNIRPKYILFAQTGVKFSLNNLRGANWRQLVFNNYRLHLLDLLSKYGEARDYGDWLNEMLSRHANIYKLAGNNWENVAYKNELVGLYLQDYKGGLGNDGQYKRYGSVTINPEDKYDFNLGISPNYNTRYNISNPPTRTSKDRLGMFKVDNLYSAITDDRRLLGREGDWNETSEDFKLWQKELNARGWETYLDKNDNYYKLRRIPTNDTDLPLDLNSRGTIENGEVVITGTDKSKQSQVPAAGGNKYGFDWDKIRGAAQKLFNNPDLWAAGRLIGNLRNNERVYDEQLKGITPELRQTYYTHRQVVGDEATKQGFYRRAAQGETKAALPFTSDADRQMAYLYEAKRIGDELRAQGDLADNQEIRRTSDESNQHQWANTQRATEVANANTASMNLANALKHNLLALKHSAQWSSIDNFLQGVEYRKRQRQAEDQALEDLLWSLNLEDFQYTPEYIAAYKKYNDVLEKHKKADGTYDYNDPEVVDAIGEVRNLIKLHLKLLILDLMEYRRKRNLINYSLSAKSGGKITRKRKDDLLYKSTRDVVEHFRKMSKISSDALNRRKSKIEKLTSYPKTKKYLQGGVAPFTIYKPVALGGETTRTSEYDTSHGSKSSASEKSSQAHDLLKELFKSLSVEGLPSDVNGIYVALNNLMARQRAFGNELSTEDIASMYILQMLLINNVKYFKSQYDLAKKIVNDRNANSEFAIDVYGRIAALDRETGKIEFLKPNDLDISKYNLLTNLNLLDLRATTPSLAYNNSILEVTANATSMEEIGKFLKAQLPKVESSESVIEGYTKKDSNLIKEGIRELLQEAPEGDYKYSVTKKSNSVQRLKALNYLYNILPDNMKTLLNLHSNGNGKALIEEMIGSEAVDTTKYEFDAVTGKAAKDANGKGSSSELEMNNALRLLTGAGGSHLLTFGIGNNNVIQTYGRQAVIADTTSNETAFGADFSYSDIYKSGVGRILDLDNASFGDVPINKAMKDSIIVDNSKIVGIDLPYRTTQDGRIVPDFAMLKKVEEADLEVLNLNLDPNKESDINKINQIYANKGLPIKYGGPTKLTGNYMRFAVILATASEDAFLNKEGLSSNKTLTLVSDDNELEKYVRLILEITKDKKYSLDKPGIFSYGDKDVYKGSIFIPITGDITDAALGGGGSKIKTGMNDNYDIMNKTWYTRNYIAPLETNFNK